MNATNDSLNRLMTILVTGSAGFIGWKVSEFLLRDGHAVIGVDNLNDAYDVRLKEWRLSQLEGKPGFKFQRLDICDRTALKDLFHSLFAIRYSPLDAVINLAARAGVRQSVENPWIYYETNVTGCLNLLELCREFGVKKFVLASTSSLYGDSGQSRFDRPERTSASSVEPLTAEGSIVNPEPRAQRSGKNRPIARPGSHQARFGVNRSPRGVGEAATPQGKSEDLEPRTLEVGPLSQPFREDQSTDHPLSPYAASKKAAEALCYTYHYLYGIDVTVLRYFTVYGPAGRPDMSLFRFVQRITEGRPITVYGDGLQSRDFTYVDDIARGTIAALFFLNPEIRNPQSAIRNPKFEVINLGSDRPVVLGDAIALIERSVGRSARIESKARHPADVMATWADIDKARQLLGWRPTTKFEEGVESLVSWYRAHRDWAKDIKTE